MHTTDTRKDLSRPGDPSAIAGRSSFKKHIVDKIAELLDDQHALRQLSNTEEAGKLSAVFNASGVRSRP